MNEEGENAERGAALYLVGRGADWDVKLAPMKRTLYTIGREPGRRRWRGS